MSASKKTNIPPETLQLYDKLARTCPGVERKGDTVPYTSVNGNMFSYLHATGGLALRLPGGERETFLAKYKAKLCEAYGVVQKEYVAVPDALLAKTAELKPYLKIGYEYAKSLKPKPAKSPKAAKKGS
jgi:hypothetical protein